MARINETPRQRMDRQLRAIADFAYISTVHPERNEDDFMFALSILRDHVVMLIVEEKGETCVRTAKEILGL